MILVVEQWDICTCAQREFHIIQYKATQWIMWWHVNKTNVLKVWQHKMAKLLHWQGSKLRREHRRALEDVLSLSLSLSLSSTQAVSCTYNSDAHGCVVLASLRNGTSPPSGTNFIYFTLIEIALCQKGVRQ
uniref:Uncharacterized protein n=1 Tax=Eutreptiella gymnastica TaxID=73025 RepID=A0A7S1JAW7_9EUGL